MGAKREREREGARMQRQREEGGESRVGDGVSGYRSWLPGRYHRAPAFYPAYTHTVPCTCTFNTRRRIRARIRTIRVRSRDSTNVRHYRRLPLEKVPLSPPPLPAPPAPPAPPPYSEALAW
jgi:hypothetical protein